MPCPECIVFAVDQDAEVQLMGKTGLTSSLELFKQTIITLAASKKRVDSRHMFCLASLKERANLVLPPTARLDELTAALTRLQPTATSFQSCELGSLITVAHSVSDSLTDSSMRVRVVLLYGRSGTLPTWHEQPGGGVALDVLYLHERPAPGVNCPQEVYEALERVGDSMSRASGHQAYIYECQFGNVRKWINIMVWMLMQPQQRPPQTQLPLVFPDLSQMAAPGSTGGAVQAKT